MTATSQSLGIMIREARKARQWSQQRLADEINSSQSAVHRIEMGQQNVSLNMIERLASALEMPLILAATEGTVNFGTAAARGRTTGRRARRTQALEDRRTGWWTWGTSSQEMVAKEATPSHGIG